VLIAEKELPTKYWDASTIVVVAAESGWVVFLKHLHRTASGHRRSHFVDKFRIGEGL
jgi:hypothetical protein